MIFYFLFNIFRQLAIGQTILPRSQQTIKETFENIVFNRENFIISLININYNSIFFWISKSYNVMANWSQNLSTGAHLSQPLAIQSAPSTGSEISYDSTPPPNLIQKTEPQEKIPNYKLEYFDFHQKYGQLIS